MGIELPVVFKEKMKERLGSEFEAFMASYDAQRWYGLRVNRLKISPADYLAIAPKEERLEPILWSEEGFYYEESSRPGKHPHYHAGLYYIQEPSAMVPAELLEVRPGDRVLDLCAAPGGKSTQLAGKLGGEGLLIANDNARERTKALAKNMELAGVRNAVVLNEEPAALADVFAGFFDRILVDAPCSGEGMFRKDESMIRQWERHSVERCSLMQHDILRHAVRMLAPGGRLVYSTCTFSPEENEDQIASLLLDHPELTVYAVPLRYGWSSGRPEWTAAASGSETTRKAAAQVAGTVRLWPHHVQGEGHYAAVLERRPTTEPGRSDVDGHTGAADSSSNKALLIRSEADAVFQKKGRGLQRAGREDYRSSRRGEQQTGRGNNGKNGKNAPRFDKKAHKHARGLSPEQSWLEFAAAVLPGAELWPGRLISYGSRIYLQPQGLPELDGLQVVRAGWYLGEAGKYKFEPSQALALGLSAVEAVQTLDFPSNSPEIIRYLKGETLQRGDESSDGQDGRSAMAQADRLHKGYVLVCTDGFPVGWGKWDGGMLKNELSAGWRWT
ncbi:RsmB/NOP family class I SAM-dependent RNA methyltransferase [Paenibacillus sp. GCM10012307]|uniref:RsmB/NOP family class I SAM-dependent RNA methyltransferase n=2 Tax=Paenibacillus TaxID=44249 RepID=A0A934J1J0_9BACL|nr:RsmB/NOP family class I SAM-dependent RNA methyltransferase [Paenibacillus roseus]MBJ6359869.1 RsmB/NOP family class I SAM-dependent RNA methyltransferase [Paenibacillus roseus]